jgi:hypothetical protein
MMLCGRDSARNIENLIRGDAILAIHNNVG